MAKQEGRLDAINPASHRRCHVVPLGIFAVESAAARFREDVSVGKAAKNWLSGVSFSDSPRFCVAQTLEGCREADPGPVFAIPSRREIIRGWQGTIREAFSVVLRVEGNTPGGANQVSCAKVHGSDTFPTARAVVKLIAFPTIMPCSRFDARTLAFNPLIRLF